VYANANTGSMVENENENCDFAVPFYESEKQITSNIFLEFSTD